jgi:hypothetical protein
VGWASASGGAGVERSRFRRFFFWVIIIIISSITPGYERSHLRRARLLVPDRFYLTGTCP